MPETTGGARRGGKTAAKTIVIEQHGSAIGCLFTHKRVLRSLGLRRIRQRVTRPDNPAVRGMVKTIPHIVRIVEA
jgi:large subunit ribosomal protein L30